MNIPLRFLETSNGGMTRNGSRQDFRVSPNRSKLSTSSATSAIASTVPNRTTSTHRTASARGGFSLLEILLAISILGASLAIIAQIADTGVDAAREARDLSLARILCQAKLSEVLLNATLGQTPQPVFEAPAEPFDSQAQSSFTYTVEIQPANMDGMLMIRVVAVAADSAGKPIATYALDRWMIDPAIGLVEAEMEEEAAKEEAAGTATETPA